MSVNTSACGWPDPECPGVPLNPERDGWHWIEDLRAPQSGIALMDLSAPRPMPWHAGKSVLFPDLPAGVWNGVMEPAAAAKEWRYLGPCFAPDEHRALLAERDALRAECARARDSADIAARRERAEAADLCDVFAEQADHEKAFLAYRRCAAAIRALTPPEDGR